MRLLEVINAEWAKQQGFFFPWAPVCYAIGIGSYFSLRAEPSAWDWLFLAIFGVFLFACLRFVTPGPRVAVCAGVLCIAGFLIAGGKAHWVAGETLGFRFYGAIEGRIVHIDRSASDAVRLTLDRVRLEGLRPERTPERVRVALHGMQGFLQPKPGVTVILTGHLSPPGGAVEPGGFDFRRDAWFQRLGAVGYTRTPVLALSPHDGRAWELWVYRQRMHISQAVQDALPGPVGGFAAAITTGDRSGISESSYDALRASNLAHLLAISGLHMGLLTGFVFGALRLGLALFNFGVSTKKIAAVGALAAGAVYLALSGGNVATERAFVMVAVMFAAVLFDRRAITLRAVALAAMIVLTLNPEVLYGPGFQMSFAATTALVAVFGAFRSHGLSPGKWSKWMRFIGGVAVSSLIAGLATAPIGAAHFNQVPHYGIVANVLSVPLMGLVIIPSAVLAAMLSPVGLGWVGLSIMGPAIRWILSVAETVSSWDGAVSHVISPSPVVLPILALAASWIVLWQGRLRVMGAPVAMFAFAVWMFGERPEVLVSNTGGLVGLMTSEGRALSKPRGDGFAAGSWLENDGDPVEQTEAHVRSAFAVEGRQRRFQIGQHILLHATGKAAAQAAMADCQEVALVIVNVVAEHPKNCNIFDLKRLRETGALAISASDNGLKIIGANEKSGRRLWSP